MNNDYAIKPFAFGPITVIALCIVIGFLIMVGYQAWRQVVNFQIPIRDILALLIVIGFLSVVAYMFVGTPNQGADILIGALVAAFSAIVAMYFHTSKKDDN
jgi:O-antigen/teichoic acid export membrane protein